MPSMLEYLGYIFFFGAFMVGPAFEFMDYRRFTNMEMFRIGNSSKESDRKSIKRENSNHRLKQLQLVNQYYDICDDGEKSDEYYVPNGFIPAMGKLSFGIFFILCFMIFGGKYPMDWTLSEEFQTISFLNK
jgi:lysophospholipid acyltransferase